MKLEVKTPETGPTRIMREKRRTTGGIEEEFTYEVAPSTPDGKDYFGVLQSPEGDSVSPEVALDAVLAGTAEILTDAQEASETLHKFARGARLSQSEEARYQRVLTAWAWTEARRREAEALKLVGLDDGDNVMPIGDRAFFTTGELANIFRVDDETIRRWSGHQLPAALRLGRKYLYRADAVLTMLRNAGPGTAPEPSKPAKK